MGNGGSGGRSAGVSPGPGEQIARRWRPGGAATARDQGSGRGGDPGKREGRRGERRIRWPAAIPPSLGGREVVAGGWQQPRGPLDIDTLTLILIFALPSILILMPLLGRDAAGVAEHNNQLGLGLGLGLGRGRGRGRA